MCVCVFPTCLQPIMVKGKNRKGKGICWNCGKTGSSSSWCSYVPVGNCAAGCGLPVRDDGFLSLKVQKEILCGYCCSSCWWYKTNHQAFCEFTFLRHGGACERNLKQELKTHLPPLDLQLTHLGGAVCTTGSHEKPLQECVTL